MQVHPVYRSLNRIMTLLGVERKLFFFVLLLAFLLFQLTDALVPAVVLFGILWVLAKAATQTDPQILRVLLNSSRFGTRYDPGKHEKGGGALG